MTLKSKQALHLEEDDILTVLAEIGYHTGERLRTCHDNNVDTGVAAPKSLNKQIELSRAI